MILATLASIIALAATAAPPGPDPAPTARPGPINWWSYHVDSPLFDENGHRIRGIKQRCYVPAKGKRRCVLVRQ